MERKEKKRQRDGREEIRRCDRTARNGNVTCTCLVLLYPRLDMMMLMLLVLVLPTLAHQ
jgi:hypothetical protein